MAVITNASHPKALWPGVRRWWGLQYNQYQPLWPQMFEKLTSKQAYEEDVETIGFGLLTTKDQAGSISYDTAQQGTVSRYTHTTFGLGFMVTLEELNDNLYEKVSFKRTTRLARSVYETEEIIHANVYNRAFTAGFTGGDGVVLCSASHPCANGNQSNLLTAADLSEAALEDAVIQIGKATNSRGLKISLRPRCLLVPVDLQFEAERIVRSVLQNDTANNATNAIRSMGVFPEGIKVNHYLTDTDAWFISTNCPNGMKMYMRRSVELEQDNDFDTKNARASSYERYSVGWSDWRATFGSPGA